MRIAVIAPPWTPVPPRLYGGIELVVDRLATGFQRAGHEVLLFTTGDSTCPVPRKWLLAEAEHQRIGMVVPELRHIMAAYEAVADYDIVHDHTVMGPVYAQRLPETRVVTTIHGPLNDELIDIYGRIAERVPLIHISHAQGRPAPHIPPARVIHHGLDVEDFPFGTGEGGYCLFLGRMSPDKGAHRATEICYKAGVPLIIAAKMREPWEHEYFNANVRPYLNDDLRYLGEVPHDEKLELLANARCLVFPIRWNEPFGMVMIEAMACGTPVLAFREGAAPEVVEHGRTGFLCDDEADMVDAIGRLDQIDRAECRASVERYFSTGRMVREHVELFDELLAR
ncbi:MAG TPA: glycosyltransferase family 4 protein [Acidimicrobiales bacterium]|jgi:glycosyltransferase involved in cell wall biosynthesis|nr:glycosyltransferase family 4 protein [Acidimicrobiales bacterium]